MTRLVLTRKLNEAVVVHKNGDPIVSVKVTKIDRNQVRITFEADEDVKIDRKEVFNYTNKQ